MTLANEKMLQLKKLHQKDKPFVLLNTWNSESVEEFKKRKIKLQGTSSYAVADYLGYEDGEKMPFAELLAYCQKIVSAKTILTVDIETGYGDSLALLESNIYELVKIGVSGINIEDKIAGSDELLSIKVFTERLKCIEATCKKIGRKLFINARSDVYFTGNIAEKNQDETSLIEALERIRAYEQAGANGIFLPGLKNKEHIQKITNETKLPLNLMLDIKENDLHEYLNLGVSRFSFGPSIYLWFKEKPKGDTKEFYNTLFKQLEVYVDAKQIELF